MDQPQPKSDHPLSGIVVVELGDSAAAPFTGHILACLGAEVWKVERPGSGDPSRSWGGPSDSWQNAGQNAGAIFHALNRGKKSVVIDLKNAAELERLSSFIDTRADVFFHNLRPGTAGRFGLDETALTGRKPSLVYCTVGAFGARGPMNRLPGFDPLMQAYSGIMSVTGEQGQAPVRAGVSLVDFGTGLWAAFGIMTALYTRQAMGAGTIVDSSLFETAIGWMSAGIATYQVSKQPQMPMGSGIAFIAPYRAYPTADGYLIVACANDRLFAKLCAALGAPQWSDDPRFRTNADRVAHRAALDALIVERLRPRSRGEWRTLLDEAGVPCSPIQTVDEVTHDPQTKALGLLSAPPDDPLPLVTLPLSFQGERPRPMSRAPRLGEHNAEFDKILAKAAGGGR
ncbi:MAG: CoA transferase [Alphaproteobacteria bacterium]